MNYFQAIFMNMKKEYDCILMDLDGTITDPGLGITRCVQFALNHWGIEVESLQDLYCFIGPPLQESFTEFYHFSKEQAEAAILKYRERFAAIGMYENEVYPGMEDLLQELNKTGKKVMVATSKPEIFARKILEHFRLDSYFSFIGGASLDGLRSRKEEVIEYVLKTNHISDLSRAVMVGDRKYDIEGAKYCGLASIGVTYGYGSSEELSEAGADTVVETVEELKQRFLEY